MVDLAEKCIETVCKIRNFPYKINVHFSSNINIDIMKYLYREKSIATFKNRDNSKYNAIALPYENHGFHIIVNNEKFTEITTIIHEATHIIDYYEFMINLNQGKIDIENHKLYYSFCLYSEFNARYEAHKFYLCFLLEKEISKDFEIDILNEHVLEFFKEKGDIETLDDFYALMQLLGRLYSIEDVCNSTYDLPAYNELYLKLKNYKNCKNNENLKIIDDEFHKLSVLF